MIQQINFEKIQEIWYEEDMWGQMAYAHPVSTMLYIEKFDQKIKNLEYSRPIFYAFMVNNKIVGVNSYHHVNNEQVRSRGLYIYKNHRGKGIAEKLLKYAIDENKNKGYKFIWSMPRSTAIVTYKKAGFQITSNVFKTLPNGKDVLYENCFCKYDF